MAKAEYEWGQGETIAEMRATGRYDDAGIARYLGIDIGAVKAVRPASRGPVEKGWVNNLPAENPRADEQRFIRDARRGSMMLLQAIQRATIHA